MPKQFGNSNIDQLFRRKLENAEVNPSDDSWEAIQGQLANTPASPYKNYILKGISAISAVTVIYVMFLFISSSFSEKEAISNSIIASNTENSNSSIYNSSKSENTKPTNTVNSAIDLDNGFLKSEKNISGDSESLNFGFASEEEETEDLFRQQTNGISIITPKSNKRFKTKKPLTENLATSNSNIKSATRNYISNTTNEQGFPENESSLASNKLLIEKASSDKQVQAIFLPNLKNLITSKGGYLPIDLKSSELFGENYYSEENINNRRQDFEIISELNILTSLPIYDQSLKVNSFKKRAIKKHKYKENSLFVGLVYQYNRSWQRLELDQNFLNNIEADIAYEGIYGNAYGFSLNWQTKRSWEFETQLILNSTQGGKFKMNYTELNEQKTSNQSVEYSYMQIPLLFKKRFHLSSAKNFLGKIKVGVIAGSQFSILKKNNNIMLGNGVDDSDVLRNYELGFISGLELDYTISKSLAFRVGGRITASNKPQSILQFHNNASTNAYNMQAGISTGLIFRLK